MSDIIWYQLFRVRGWRRGGALERRMVQAGLGKEWEQESPACGFPQKIQNLGGGQPAKLLPALAETATEKSQGVRPLRRAGRGPLLFRFVRAVRWVDTVHLFPFGLFGGHSKGWPRPGSARNGSRLRGSRSASAVARRRRTRVLLTLCPGCAAAARRLRGGELGHERGELRSSHPGGILGVGCLRRNPRAATTDLTVGLMGSSEKSQFNPAYAAWLCL